MRWSNVALIIALAGLAVVFGLACLTFRAPDVPGPDAPAAVTVATPFIGLPVAQPGQGMGATIAEASENYRRLLNDQLPGGTCRDDGAFSDGGTRTWECAGYSLELRRSLASVAGKPGLLYGPVLTLESGAEVSHVEFYTEQALDQRLGIKDGI